MQLRAAASGLLLALLAGQTLAASFDCSKASSFPEKEICRDGYLSGLDDWLAKSYKTALEVNPAQYEAVRQSQREWLDTRDACTDQKCLDKTIGARIQALDLRIPRHPATQSTLIWPGIPRPSGHLFHGHPAGQSERS
ncbi:lysozyme inhibitor LprI family protein, partial [Pseudomonas aeruginosa]